MATCKLKKGDMVVVRSGRDKGKSGEILALFPKEARALVRGVHMVKRHQKPDAQNPKGGIVSRESRIHLSNLGALDKASGKPSRLGFRIGKDGKKERVLRRSGEVF